MGFPDERTGMALCRHLFLSIFLWLFFVCLFLSDSGSFVLVYIILLYYSFMNGSLFSHERKRKEVNAGGKRGGEDLLGERKM